MSVPEDLESLYTAAAAAMDAGNYLAAKQGFLKLEARRAASPDVERSFGSGGRQSIKWRDVDLSSLISHCDKMLASTKSVGRGPLSAIPIRYKRPTSTDTY